MTIGNGSNKRIPVICADEMAAVSAEIFNPNFWIGASKGIIQSCWTEYSVLHYCIGKIVGICKKAEQLCQKQIKSIQQQWSISRFDLEKVVIYCQQPDLHLHIEAFFSGVKTFLDLIVQLLSSEKVVSGVVDGFHRAKDVYGGKILNALTNNASNDRKETAGKVMTLISQHKTMWIDQAVFARDQFIHPERGMHQLMFRLEFTERNGKLVCVRVTPPQIDSQDIDQYARKVLKNMHEFSSSFLALIR